MGKVESSTVFARMSLGDREKKSPARSGLVVDSVSVYNGDTELILAVFESLREPPENDERGAILLSLGEVYDIDGDCDKFAFKFERALRKL